MPVTVVAYGPYYLYFHWILVIIILQSTFGRI